MPRGPRTASLWGAPPSRFYSYLRRVRVREELGAEFDLGVFGCADGKFVLPAARQSMRVLAVDADRSAVFGGPKLGLRGPVYMPGLMSRVRAEGLEGRVEAVCADFMELAPRRCSGLYVSGAIQYSMNISWTAADIVLQLMRSVVKGGILYIDYMLPYELKYIGRPNCPETSWWQSWPYSVRGWRVVYNRVLRPVLDTAHVEYPVDHYHHWGHVLMCRLE